MKMNECSKYRTCPLRLAVVTEVQRCIRTDSCYRPCLEFPVLITAAQGNEGHFEGLPHRVQVVFDHLLEQGRHHLWSQIGVVFTGAEKAEFTGAETYCIRLE